MKIIKNRLFLVAVLLTVAAMTVHAQVNTTTALLGAWSGKLNVGPMSLILVLHLEQEDGYVKVLLDSPDQGAKGISPEALEDIAKWVRTL